MDGESSRHENMRSLLQDGGSDPHNLPLEYLRKITKNFADERLLGEGGFGIVYKGVLQTGEMIAVKKLASSVPGVKDRQFENEAQHLMRLKHPNIVLLLGCCSETEHTYVEYKGKYICAEKSERLLCLEYMPKGNLRGYLSDESSGLDWGTRYSIIEGICYGLHYLHEAWQLNSPIIHMDLKPANILLDTNMVPKIADFGLSRIFGEEQTWTHTKNCEGTLGYMAPEYIQRGIITKKLDIFSLGVIIIEIITGHKEYPDETTAPSSEEFVERVLRNWRCRMEKSPEMSQEVDYQQIRRCIQIGLECVKFDRSGRPSTSQILDTLHASSHREESTDANKMEVLRRKSAIMNFEANDEEEIVQVQVVDPSCPATSREAAEARPAAAAKTEPHAEEEVEAGGDLNARADDFIKNFYHHLMLEQKRSTAVSQRSHLRASHGRLGLDSRTEPTR
ncbi:unnamed protein product [Urochloa humidicola]